MHLQKITEKQRKKERKRCNLTVLWKKSFLCLQKPGRKFAERDDI